MKLSYYIKKLQEIEKRHPNAVMVFEVADGVFKKVCYTPTEGHFKQGDGILTDSEFSTKEKDEVNSVCIN